MASPSSKKTGLKVYNPKPISQAPPDTDPVENGVPFKSDEIFDRTPIIPGDPKRPVELPPNWIMEERVRKTGKQIGGRYMIFIEPETGEYIKSVEGVRRHLGLETKKSKFTSPKKNAEQQPTSNDVFEKHEDDLGEEFGRDMTIRESKINYTHGLKNRRNDGASSSSSRPLRPDKAPTEGPYDDRK